MIKRHLAGELMVARVLSSAGTLADTRTKTWNCLSDNIAKFEQSSARRALERFPDHLVGIWSPGSTASAPYEALKVAALNGAAMLGGAYWNEMELSLGASRGGSKATWRVVMSLRSCARSVSACDLDSRYVGHAFATVRRIATSQFITRNTESFEEELPSHCTLHARASSHSRRSERAHGPAGSLHSYRSRRARQVHLRLETRFLRAASPHRGTQRKQVRMFSSLMDFENDGTHTEFVQTMHEDRFEEEMSFVQFSHMTIINPEAKPSLYDVVQRIVMMEPAEVKEFDGWLDSSLIKSWSSRNRWSTC